MFNLVKKNYSKATENMQSAIEIKSYKKQIEEAEEIACSSYHPEVILKSS